MGELNCKLKNFLVQLLLLMVFIVSFTSFVSGEETVFLNKVTIEQAPCLVKLYVTKKVPSKFIKVDKNEVLLALKDVKYKGELKIIGSKGALIKSITLQRLQGNVVAVLVTGNRNFDIAKAEYNETELCFVINLEKATQKPDNKVVVKKSVKDISKQKQYKVIEPKVTKTKSAIVEKETKEVKEKEQAKKPEKTIVKSDTKDKGYTPLKKEKSIYAGDISDLLLKVDITGCNPDNNSGELEKAFLLLKQTKYKAALDILEQYLTKENQTCLEAASYLRAYAYFKYGEIKEPLKLVQAEHYFHTALVTYPDSKLIPFGFATIGLIHLKINNSAVAEGYLTIVKDKYKDYPGLAEVYYFLAEIYKERGFNEKALRSFKKVFEEMPDNKYTAEAGIGYGNTLFDKNFFLDALNIYKYIIKENKEKIYKTSDLLLSMGNANMKLGRSSAARDNYTRVINLFPKIGEKDIIFSKIADTYAMENKIEKAKSMYSFVREKFPDGEGFIRSSIGLARHLEDRKEREKLYIMVKKRFPEDKFARVAMMRLAEIYQEHKEYENCIKEIEEMLSTNPMGLRYEAIRLMQKSYEALFARELKADKFTIILQEYEENFVRLDRMTSKEISLKVGLSYLKAKLYEQAFNHLISSYKLHKRSKRPADLLFGMGVAMHETSRTDDAIKLFKGFVKRFPKNQDVAEAYLRMGNIYLSKDEYIKSGGMFERAYKNSKNPMDKSNILVKKSKLYEKQGEWAKVTFVLANAVEDIASAPGKHYDFLSTIYRTMGNAYLKQRVYVRAAESFSLAIKFSEFDTRTANLMFMMGDAYQKANVLKEATKVFKSIAQQDDSVWARLAEQRLSTLALAENAKSS
ncbi:MAG: tetratricopeptide repeat protein [Desulfobacterales bacterium]|nr:tetratricopeptide repeat protein [Desulfobacterales bacterium]